MKKIVIFLSILLVIFLGYRARRECWSVSDCPMVNKQEVGVAKKSINDINEEVVAWVAEKSAMVEKIEIKAGNYGGVLRKVSCRIMGPSGGEIAPARESVAFTSSSGANWREINYANLEAKIIQGQKYEIRCKGQDSWNSMYWIYDPSLGKTFRVYGCEKIETSPTGIAITEPVISPSPTATPVLSNNKVKIVHFSDIGGEPPSDIFGLLKKYEGVKVVFLGSGDYVVYPELVDLERVKKAVDSFVGQSSFGNEDIILALGNHDDPGRVGTWKWNQVWNNSRPAEGVIIKNNLIIAWLHTEKPDLVMIEAEIAKKRAICADCVAIMIGHKPVVMEAGMEAYQSYMLPIGWREQVLALLKKYNFKFYLTGHFEVHSTLTSNGVVHNRATPARNGFEEINFETELGGEIKNLNVITRDYNFVGTGVTMPVPTQTKVTPTASPTPTTGLISGSCHKECVSNDQCQSGQICARNYNVRPDGAKICLNWYCSAETDCICSWQE